LFGHGSFDADAGTASHAPIPSVPRAVTLARALRTLRCLMRRSRRVMSRLLLGYLVPTRPAIYGRPRRESTTMVLVKAFARRRRGCPDAARHPRCRYPIRMTSIKCLAGLHSAPEAPRRSGVSDRLAAVRG